MTTTSITVRYDEDFDATVVNVYDMGEIVANHDGTVDVWLNVALARDDEPQFERGLADRGVTLKSAIQRLAASVTLGPDDPATIRAALTDAAAQQSRRERCPICGGLNPGDSSHTRCM